MKLVEHLQTRDFPGGRVTRQHRQPKAGCTIPLGEELAMTALSQTPHQDPFPDRAELLTCPQTDEFPCVTTRSARGVTVTVSRIPTPEGRIPTIQAKYGKGGRGKICWWPDVERCRDQIAEVLEHFKNDCTSLGFPIRQAGKGSREAITAWNQARKGDPRENADVK